VLSGDTRDVRYLASALLAALALYIVACGTPIDRAMPFVGVIVIFLAWLVRESRFSVAIEAAVPLLVAASMAFPEERVRLFDKGVTSLESPTNVQDIPMSYRYGEIRSPYIAFEEPLTVMDRHFLSCVADGIRPSTDGMVGLAVVQALECAAVSLRERRQVAIDELSRPTALEPELVGVP